MTSSHVVTDNLTAAGELLREAKDLGCDIACLPENFSFIGLRDADKLQVSEADGAGAVQSFLSDTARKLGKLQTFCLRDIEDIHGTEAD